MPTVNGINYSQKNCIFVFGGTTLSFDDLQFSVKRSVDGSTANSSSITDIEIGADIPNEVVFDMKKKALDTLLGYSVNGLLTDIPASPGILTETTEDGALKVTHFFDLLFKGYDYKTKDGNVQVTAFVSRIVPQKIS